MLTTKQSTAEAKMLVKCDLKMRKFSVIGGKKEIQCYYSSFLGRL